MRRYGINVNQTPDLHQCKCHIQNTFNDSKFSKFIHVLNIECTCSLKDNFLPFKE